jgi:apolipoprotein N-acyltransferase
LVRCASTGETCIISAVGEITARMPLDQKGVLIGVASHLHETTLYRLFPHLLDWLVVLAGSSTFALARKVGTSREKTLVPSG